MRTYSRGGRVQISARLPAPLLAEVAELGAVERWSQSATIEALVAEALDARARAAERSQDARTPGTEGQHPGRTASEALSASQPVGGAR